MFYGQSTRTLGRRVSFMARNIWIERKGPRSCTLMMLWEAEPRDSTEYSVAYLGHSDRER